MNTTLSRANQDDPDDDIPGSEPRRVGQARSKRLLVTLLGDFWEHGRDPFPSARLVRILQEFQITPANARAALSRLTQQGLLARTKQGRRTSYAPTPLTIRLLEQGGERIFARTYGQGWDGTWTLVAFSIPSDDGDLRRLLRARLRWLTFAPVFDATWVTPRDRAEIVREQLDDLGVTDAMVLRTRELDLRSGGRARLDQAWRLDELAERYAEFLRRYTPLAQRSLRGEVSRPEALVERTELVDDWRRVIRDDPEVPSEFLPDNFPRSQAREVFLDTYEALATDARLRFEQLLIA